MKKPSEEFIRAICNTGSVCVTCELCGVTMFVSGVECFEKGELEDLQKKAKENPKKYQEITDYDTIEFGNFDGKQIVPFHSDECDKKIRHYEDWVLSHRYILADYLNKRGKKLIHESKMDAEMTRINSAAESCEPGESQIEQRHG